MEEKLAAYRRRRKREQTISNFKNKIFGMFTISRPEVPEEKVLIDISEKVLLRIIHYKLLFQLYLINFVIQVSDVDDETIKENQFEAVDDESLEDNDTKDSTLNFIFYFLSFLCWATVYVIAIKFGFGIVYMLISALIGIYLNTRTTPKKAGEVSAYSVFNKDCHSIDGTLKAEQFEREIRYGAASVR